MTGTAQPDFAAIGHARFVADVRAVARALAADAWRPDHIVGIGRGGLVPGTYLSHRTGIPLLSVDHSAGVAAFGEQLIARLADITRTGRRILLVDDINDSGKTILTLRAMLDRQRAEPGHARFAVLIDNIRSAARVEYRARTIDRTQEKRWFVFPWEAMAPHTVLMNEARSVPERLA